MNLPATKLAEDWRREAESLERRGLQEPADVLRSCAEDAEQAVREWEMEVLTLDQAAEESELTRATLRKKVARGEIPNAGKRNDPKVLRRDVPKRKPLRSEMRETPVDDLIDRNLSSKKQAS